MIMTNFKVSKNSWHYKFQDFFGLMPWRRRDFCSYWRGFIGAVLFVGLLLTLLSGIVFFSYLTGDDLFGDKFNIVLTTFFGFLAVASVPALILGLAFIFYLLHHYIIDVPTKLVEKEGTIFNVKYKSWKEKYCPMVEFIDE